MYEMNISPKFGDVDGLGHVNNTILPEWFEQARNPIYKIFNPTFTFADWNLIVARFEVDFVSQLYLEHDALIKSSISKVGNTSFEVYQEAHQQNNLCARGKTVLVHYDFKKQKSVQIPKALRESLQEQLLITKATV